MYLTPAYRLMRNAEKKRILEGKTDSRLRIDDDENEMMKGYREVAFMRRWAVGGQLALASALAEGRCRLLVEERSFCRVVMCKRRVGSVFVARKYRQVGIRCLDRKMSVNFHRSAWGNLSYRSVARPPSVCPRWHLAA